MKLVKIRLSLFLDYSSMKKVKMKNLLNSGMSYKICPKKAVKFCFDNFL